MSQSLTKLFIHIVFTTKNREKCIYPEIEAELFNYLKILCQEENSTLVAIGGTDDHIHLLVSLSKNLSLSSYLSKIKSNSSRWLKSRNFKLKNFSWQNGYGAFSVDFTRLEQIIGYILNQKENHKKVSFKEEFLGLLNDHHVDFDERYLWD